MEPLFAPAKIKAPSGCFFVMDTRGKWRCWLQMLLFHSLFAAIASGVGDGIFDVSFQFLGREVCDGVPTISLIVYYRSGVTPLPVTVAKWEMKV